jgi:hypothetical protein
MNSASKRPSPRSERPASGRIGRRCAPSGSVAGRSGVGAKIGDDVAPLGAVHRQSVHEHDDGAGADVLVLDRPRLKLDLGHQCLPVGLLALAFPGPAQVTSRRRSRNPESAMKPAMYAPRTRSACSAPT